MDNLSLLKGLLTRLFKNEKIATVGMQELQRSSMESNANVECENNSSFDDLSKDDAVKLTVPFVDGVLNNDRKSLERFIETVIKLGIFETRDGDFVFPEAEVPGLKYSTVSDAYHFDPQRVYSDVLSEKLSRNDKIYINRRIVDFRPDYIDWEDKEFLKKMLKSCFYRAVLLIKALTNEDSIKKVSDDISEKNRKPTQIYKLMPCGHLNPLELKRKDLLKRKFEPAQTLDEYVENLLKHKSKASARNSNNIDNDKNSEENRDVQRIRQSDDFNDFRRNFRGNTRNVG